MVYWTSTFFWNHHLGSNTTDSPGSHLHPASNICVKATLAQSPTQQMCYSAAGCKSVMIKAPQIHRGISESVVRTKDEPAFTILM